MVTQLHSKIDYPVVATEIAIFCLRPRCWQPQSMFWRCIIKAREGSAVKSNHTPPPRPRRVDHLPLACSGIFSEHSLKSLESLPDNTTNTTQHNTTQHIRSTAGSLQTAHLHGRRLACYLTLTLLLYSRRIQGHNHERRSRAPASVNCTGRCPANRPSANRSYIHTHSRHGLDAAFIDLSPRLSAAK